MRNNIFKQIGLTALTGAIICGFLQVSILGQKGSGRSNPLPNANTATTTICPPTVATYGSVDGKLPNTLINKDTYSAIANCYQSEPNEEYRNKMIFLAVAQIDLYFYSHERSKRHRNNLFQTVINVLEVGAATAISITNGERAKSVIANALGFLQGSRDSINKNYGLLERQILVNKMIEKRALILTDIYKKTNEPVAQYPFERAYLDIVAYYQAGTKDGALYALASDTGARVEVAQNRLDTEKQKAGILPAPTAAQIKTSTENAEFVTKIAEDEEKAREDIAKAQTLIDDIKKELEKLNTEEEPNQAKIKQLEDKIKAETTNKTNATNKQKADLEKLKKIYQAMKQDAVISPIIDKLPDNLSDTSEAEKQRIKTSLDKIEDGSGLAIDYQRVELKVLSVVTEMIPQNPTIADRSTNLLKSIE